MDCQICGKNKAELVLYRDKQQASARILWPRLLVCENCGIIGALKGFIVEEVISINIVSKVFTSAHFIDLQICDDTLGKLPKGNLLIHFPELREELK